MKSRGKGEGEARSRKVVLLLLSGRARVGWRERRARPELASEAKVSARERLGRRPGDKGEHASGARGESPCDFELRISGRFSIDAAGNTERVHGVLLASSSSVGGVISIFCEGNEILRDFGINCFFPRFKQRKDEDMAIEYNNT